MFGFESACEKKKTMCEKEEEKKAPSRCQKKHQEQKKKCCEPGKITRNAFFSFLREFRVKHCDWHVTKIAVEGAKCWCSMIAANRERTLKEVVQAKMNLCKRQPNSIKLRSVSHPKNSRGRKFKSGSSSRWKGSKFRRSESTQRLCDWHVTEIAVKGAKCWCSMNAVSYSKPGAIYGLRGPELISEQARLPKLI